jgi:hypothetical protein
VDDILIHGSTKSAVIFRGHTTQPYKFNQFEEGANSAPPVANAGGPYWAAEGQSVQLDASRSIDTDGPIDRYAWELAADGAYDDATGVTTGYMFAESGPYVVGLQVTDNTGDEDTTQAQVTVTNTAPLVQFDSALIPYEFAASTPIFITVTDVVGDPLYVVDVFWTDEKGDTLAGLPAWLKLSAPVCELSPYHTTCTWTINLKQVPVSWTNAELHLVFGDDDGLTTSAVVGFIRRSVYLPMIKR